MIAITPLPSMLYIDHVECGSCGIHFGLERSFVASRRADHLKFYCPNGCRVNWSGPSEAERLKNQLAAATAREDQLKAELQSKRVMLSQERSRVRGLRGMITKTKKRVGHGVCPCCTRTFQNVARHMASQHPEYAGEAVE